MFKLLGSKDTEVKVFTFGMEREYTGHYYVDASEMDKNIKIGTPTLLEFGEDKELVWFFATKDKNVTQKEVLRKYFADMNYIYVYKYDTYYHELTLVLTRDVGLNLVSGFNRMRNRKLVNSTLEVGNSRIVSNFYTEDNDKIFKDLKDKSVDIINYSDIYYITDRPESINAKLLIIEKLEEDRVMVYETLTKRLDDMKATQAKLTTLGRDNFKIEEFLPIANIELEQEFGDVMEPNNIVIAQEEV